MGTKPLSPLKTHFDSIKACFANTFVPGNMFWVFTSLKVFVCNYVLHSFWLILRFIFRIGKADGINEPSFQPEEDAQIDGFREELINFLFPCNEYINEAGEERETENSLLMESVNDFDEDDIKDSGDEGAESSVSEESREEEKEEAEDEEEEKDFSASMIEEGKQEFDASTKINSDFYDGGVKNEKEGAKEEEKEETGMSSLMEGEEIERKEEETESPALMANKFEYVSGRDIVKFVEEPTTTMTFSFREFFVGPYVSDTQILEHKSEKEKSAGAQYFREFHLSPNGSQGEISELESEPKPVFQEEDQKEISELKSEEEKSIEEQSFPEFHLSPNGSELEISDLKSEDEPVFQQESQKESDQEQSMPSYHASSNVLETENFETKSEEEKEGSIQEQNMFHGHSSSDQFSLKSELFRGRDSSDDEDDLDFIDNSLESDSESESSSSSGLIWGNSDKTDDLITYEFLAYQKGFEGLEPETLKLMEKLRAIDEFIELAPGKAENEEEKKKLSELESEEEDDDEDGLEWDDDELAEQMKMEMRNARQGGLPTILEDEEEQEQEQEGQEDSDSPKMAQDLKPLKIEEEKLEFKDHIREIQKVHKSYQEKMRKLDILNYQTMHALGNNQN